MKTSEKTDVIFQKLFEVKQELGSVTKKSDNPFFKSKYADLNQHLETIEPVLASKGLFLLQPPSVNDTNGSTIVETSVIEPQSGQFVTASMTLALTKQDMQQMGAAITYARRFILNSLFGMKSEDDDGETAVGRGKSNFSSKTETPNKETSSLSTTTKRSSFRKSKTETVANETSSNDEAGGWE